MNSRVITMKRVVFLTGTRADYGKLKSLIQKVESQHGFEGYIFVTGMHMISKYGSTYREIERDGFENIYKYINQKLGVGMDIALSNTILGFSNYINEIQPDIIVIHGDRLEALAGAIVGSFNNIKVIHIEGGEISGTIDESIRHAVTKLSHFHLVANEEAKARVMQLGESEDSIFIIGSPDIDVMFSKDLPSIHKAKERYQIFFREYGIFMYHPVTTEVHLLRDHIKSVVQALLASNRNYVVVYPNNDEGTSIILEEIQALENHERFRVFPSIRFEYFLTLLKHSKFIIGNSSAGIRESGVYSIPAIDIGSRQKGRYNQTKKEHIIHVNEMVDEILEAINQAEAMIVKTSSLFGDGRSTERFIHLLQQEKIWDQSPQKSFQDIKVPLAGMHRGG
ncbi:UDP-N-acetylglucosamine 2-epimerase (hydrolysing) [Evansella caseinilytica]|uniref:UDP-N-acetylglucosamine 2-epimerase (Hydrolysing) n=1 Tax=Evansella caseinilytica TaxID=1503961 RepID=A0A1H3T936_9BACI|nr:UDP-N-acetylglucosamine 2-epimerase (hydrolysing) [Evansella caseinilytica]